MAGIGTIYRHFRDQGIRQKQMLIKFKNATFQLVYYQLKKYFFATLLLSWNVKLYFNLEKKTNKNINVIKLVCS